MSDPTTEQVAQLTTQDENEEDNQLYGQSKRSMEFTTENHKLEIDNLPRHIKYHVVRQLLERNYKLEPHKIRVGSGKAFIAFTSQELRDQAIEKINNQEYKGKLLIAKPAAPRDDPLVKKLRTDVKVEQSEEAERPVTDEEMNSQVCPLWDKSYEDQLKFKDSLMRSILNMGKQIAKLSNNMKKDAPELQKWIEGHPKVCCQFDGVTPSPTQNGYRNKCEFNIGSDGTVGFRMGRYKNGSERVIYPPANCPILSMNMFSIIEAFQAVLKNEKDTSLKGFDHVTHEGNLRQLTVRSNEKNECLVIIDLHPQDLSEEALNQELEPFINSLKAISNVVSIYLNISEKNHLSNSDQTLKLAHGEAHLFEYLEIEPERPLRFRIGPSSFFQINTRAAEILYRSILEVANLGSQSLVLDVGCGTGTISLSLARKVSYVLGIEIVESAVADAKINAEENEISNVSFFAGKAEDLINECIKILKGKLAEQNHEGEIVAIVDPPRTGFNSSFIKAIRSSDIKKIVYVACDPKANSNLLSLCRPRSKAYQGDPFVPTRAKAFDLFPHTKFCELLIVYERLSDKHV